MRDRSISLSPREGLSVSPTEAYGDSIGKTDEQPPRRRSGREKPVPSPLRFRLRAGLAPFALSRVRVAA